MIRRAKNIYHLAISVLANVIHQFPSRKLFVIGVTGTDGKTTTSSLIYHILKESGKKVALITTVGARIGDREYDTGFHTTTPSPLQLQKYIKKIMLQGHQYLVLEVTSHALDQNRVTGIPFQIGVLTNITHEHLDYHKTYEKYVDAKFKLLKRAKVVVMNRDDESYKLISSFKFPVSSKKITYGLSSDADINTIVFPFKTNLLGEFNRYNCLAAIAVCREIGLSDRQIHSGLSTFQLPVGRQEIVFDKGFCIMIDFAHTPNAFAQILPSIRQNTKGRIIHVFGAAGKRDSSKRPIMGKIASGFDDIIVLTSEDPRGEAVGDINREIESGIRNQESGQGNFQFSIFNFQSNPNFQFEKNKKYIIEIPDRSKAIEFAIKIAQKSDFVLLTGKAHERSMNLGHGELLWDEFEVVKNALVKKHAG